MIPLMAIAAVAGLWAALRYRQRRAARRVAADRAELAAHEDWAARMRAAEPDRDVVLLDARRRARLAVQREALAEDLAGTYGALGAYDPCHGADEQYARHLDVCVPWYEHRAATTGEAD